MNVESKNENKCDVQSFTTASSSLIRQISTRLPKRLKTRFRKPSEEEQQQQNLIANDISLESGISTLTNRAFSIIVSGCGDPHDLQDDYKSNNISEDLEIMAANLEVNRFLPQDSLESNMDQSTEKRLKWSGAVLKRAMIANAPKLIADRKLSNAVNAYSSPRSFKNCMIGTEMVDWLISYSNKLVSNRLQVVGAWQALLESGVICHATNEHFFNDKYLFYRWSEEDCTILNNEHQSSKIEDHNLPSSSNSTTSKDQDFVVALGFLLHVGTDALFRMILRKSPKERTPEEIDVVFDEMLNIKAFTNLSTLVKRELASVMMFEQYQNAGTILFRQGDKGKSWYVIVKGSVNVIIHNKNGEMPTKICSDLSNIISLATIKRWIQKLKMKGQLIPSKSSGRPRTVQSSGLIKKDKCPIDKDLITQDASLLDTLQENMWLESPMPDESFFVVEVVLKTNK
uniref:Uncharacterized protein n=1 Tax=Romanomermis culicivorax TaxID=13658 RepID=A0A915JQM4_ROMCU